jgi:hypothetical protein
VKRLFMLFALPAVLAASVGASSASAGRGGVSTSGCGIGFAQIAPLLSQPVPGSSISQIALIPPSTAVDCGANHGSRGTEGGPPYGELPSTFSRLAALATVELLPNCCMRLTNLFMLRTSPITACLHLRAGQSGGCDGRAVS